MGVDGRAGKSRWKNEKNTGIQSLARGDPDSGGGERCAGEVYYLRDIRIGEAMTLAELEREYKKVSQEVGRVLALIHRGERSDALSCMADSYKSIYDLKAILVDESWMRSHAGEERDSRTIEAWRYRLFKMSDKLVWSLDKLREV